VVARILPFPVKGDRSVMITMLRNALMVAAIIAGVMLVDNMTGRKISTALAA